MAVSHCIPWIQTQLILTSVSVRSDTSISCGLIEALNSTEHRAPTLGLVLGQ